MTTLLWDQVGERFYETGVDRGVLYLPTGGVYDEGVAWSGLTAVTESPSGAAATPTYADNIKYLNLISIEEFAATITAYTYPDEFAECDGSAVPTPGVAIGQQNRRIFGFCYRTKRGNDLDADLGYKLHLVYNCLAAPSEKAHATVNDTPAAIEFSWTLSTTAIPVTGHKPTATITIDSTEVNAAKLLLLENALYGTSGTDARLPLPDEVIAIFDVVAVTLVTPTRPAFVNATGVLTVPTVTGVRYRRMDTHALMAAGAQPAIAAGATLVVNAEPISGDYAFTTGSDDDYSFTRDP